MTQELTALKFKERQIPDIFEKFKADLMEARAMSAQKSLVNIIKSSLGVTAPGGLLSSRNAELGLLLINALAEYRDNNGRTYHEEVAYKSNRYNRIEELLGKEGWDDQSNYNLLIYFLGTEKAAYAVHAWKRMPYQMYQIGYARRSFRSPENPEMYLRNQINFIVKVIPQSLTFHYDSDYRYVYSYYDFTIPEQIKYSHALGDSNPSLFWLWSAAIDMGNKEAFTELENIIYNKDTEGKVTRSILKALLNSDRQEAWVLVEKLLLAAQRQEGLRQTVLESLDETSIGALKYMLRVIIDHQLARFSSVVRAVDVWAGLGWETERESTVKSFLEKAVHYLENPGKIPEAIASENNGDVYMALWAQGVYDVEKTIPYLDQLYRTGDVQKRTLALLFTEQTGHYKIQMPLYEIAIEDIDLEPMACAVNFIYNAVIYSDGSGYYNTYFPDLFYKLNRAYQRITIKEKTFECFVFSWTKIRFEKRTILRAMLCLVEGMQERLDIILAYFDDMDADVKRQLSTKILPVHSAYNYNPGETKTEELTEFQRRYAILLLKDRSEYQTAYKALCGTYFKSEEWALFPDLLKRKAAGFRNMIITLLLKQQDAVITGVMDELLLQGDPEQRLAGLDILLQLKKDRRLLKESRLLISAFQERKNINTKEEILLSQLTGEEESKDISAANGYGLYNPANLAKPVLPAIDPGNIYEQLLKRNGYAFSIPFNKIKEAVADLDDLLIQNRDFEYEVENWDNTKEKVLLGNVFRQLSWGKSFPGAGENYNDYPLGDVWRNWYQKWNMSPGDLWILSLTFQPINKMFAGVLSIQFPPSEEIIPGRFRNMQVYLHPLSQIFQALMIIHPFDKKDEFYLGAAIHLFNSFDNTVLKYKRDTNHFYYAAGTGWQHVHELNLFLTGINLEKLDDKYVSPCWNMYNWRQYSGLDENITDSIPPLIIFCRAYEQGIITKDEMYRGLLTPDNIKLLSAPKRHVNEYDYFSRFPFLKEIFNHIQNYLLDIELKRGDSATPVTFLASGLRSLKGVNRFAEIIAGLGKTNLYKGYIYSGGGGDRTKQESFSTLLKSCHPLATDTQAMFDERIKKTGVHEARLVEAAMYAPQWQKLVSGYLGWKGLDSAIWWMHAHTKTDSFTAQNAEAESEIARYSSIDVQEFKLGAVDKEWFLQAYKEIGKERWPAVYDAAKYISDGNGHRRARIYADVLQGNLTLKDVSEKINTKRDQDYLRIYGLVPLNKTGKAKDILHRYEYLQQFKKESRQFGAMKQSSEASAISVAMENLARNAGYTDPIRLTWAMETRQVQTILSKETQVQYDDVLIGLVIDEEGQADVVAFKDDKQLKAVPAKYKKDKKIEELNGFKKTLREQFKRSKKGLEEAMVRGDVFDCEEIRNLFSHPVISKHLEKLVLMLDGTQEDGAHGFYNNGILTDAKRQECVLKDKDKIRIAHCTDLYRLKAWPDYQRFAFDKKLQQPFKQIFRELYLPTEDEHSEKSISRRYAGHQVQPKQTVALLKSRGWKVNYEEGLQKVFHKQGFAAKMYAMADWFSPAEMESPTLETVVFTDLKTFEKVEFKLIDARIFSEVMRDIDLVVSVAHAGGVDPEASHSSIEMRSVLLKETMRLFKLSNVEVAGSHAKIKGELGEYSVHLGSAVVHKMGQGYLSILPVHSQHRGRLFLPFVDDDPKSAELISKVLLLARDEEIQDPTILRQMN